MDSHHQIIHAYLLLYRSISPGKNTLSLFWRCLPSLTVGAVQQKGSFTRPTKLYCKKQRRTKKGEQYEKKIANKWEVWLLKKNGSSSKVPSDPQEFSWNVCSWNVSSWVKAVGPRWPLKSGTAVFSYLVWPSSSTWIVCRENLYLTTTKQSKQIRTSGNYC